MEYIIIIIAFLVLLFGNIPIAFIFGSVGLFALMGSGFRSLEAVRQVYHGVDSFSLMAIPFFVFAGKIMSAGDITKQLLTISDSLVGWMKGSLGHVNVMASILFAGISGAAVSDVSALGSMLIPAMEERGYTREYSAAITAASSMIGPIIPPSIPVIVYAATVNMSIGALFAAGIIPGVALGIILMIMNYYFVVKRGYESKKEYLTDDMEVVKADNTAKRIFNYLKNIVFSVKNGILALVMFIIIFGGILGGVFTATEAAGFAAAYAILITTLILRTLDIKGIWKVLLDSASMTGMVMLVIAGGQIISHYLVMEGIPNMIANYMLNVTEVWWVFMIICVIFLMFVGTFMSLTPSIIILAPVLTPVAIEFGIHPYHFGLVFVFALNTALITPPVGQVLFIVTGISDIKFEDLVKEMLPFYFAFIVVLILLIFVQPLTTYLPALFNLM